MADIVFRPTFVHKEFVDGPDGDRVRADEPNGFNARFGAIESDLRQLSTVVGQIDTALDRRGTGPAGHVLTLAPLLLWAAGDPSPGESPPAVRPRRRAMTSFTD